MGYNVKVRPSGHRFTVDEHERILDAALRQGLNFPYGCRSGFCNACKGKVVAGQIVYPDGHPDGLSAGDDAAGLALFCQACATGDLEIEIREIGSAAEIETRKLPCRVQHMQRLSHDVMALYLKLPDSQRLQYLAGQYIDILLRDGRRRSFSIANPPHDDALIELHVRRVDGGDFTNHVFETMKEKDILRIEGPLGNFYWREDLDRPMIFMAGGTGLAPIKSIVEHLLAEGAQQTLYLYWGVRAAQDLYLPDRPWEWVASPLKLRFIPVLSEPRPGDDWQGRTGYVHEAVAADFPDLSDHVVYASGPPPMVEAGRAAFTAQGLDPELYFFDSFDFQDPKPAA